MAEINKPDYTYLWSSGGSIVAPSNTKIQTGWTAEVPPFQWENWSQNRQDQAIAHIFQKGISVWSATQDYYFTINGTRSYVQGSDGQIYVAVANSLNQNPVTDTTNTYWKKAFNDQIGQGQCRLSVTSPTTIALKPFNGNRVTVNGASIQLPSAGVTYTISGLTASTVYYVYLAGTTASPVLNVSTTAYATDIATGMTVKSGDATQTLVGMVYTNASTQFVDSAASRTCLNWFNRRKIVGSLASIAGFTFTSTTAAEINTALRVTFLCWADDIPVISTSGTVNLSVQGTPNFAISIDSAGSQYSPTQSLSLATGFSGGFSITGGLGSIAEGKHIAIIVGATNTGTATVPTIQTITQVNG